jgi:hypothetical protein
MSFAIPFVCWLPVGRLILIQDRELVSSCSFVWRDLVFLWCTEGEGCPSVLVLKSGGPITFDSRSESVLWISYGFRLFMVSFSGSEVEEWWKLNDLSDRNFSDVAQLWWWE